MPEELYELFGELYRLVESFNSDDCKPCLQWARKNRENLARIGSSLEFDLHKFMFIQMVEKGETLPALHYAQAEFGYFSSKRMNGKWVESC